MLFQGEARELTGSNDFSLRSHELKAEMDTQNQTVTILLDSVPIFENVPVSPGYRFSPAVSFSTNGESMGVFIHNVTVDVLEPGTGKKWLNLFIEDFDNFYQGSLPMEGGWKVSGIEQGQGGTARIDRLHAYAEKSLRLQTGSANETVIKRFSLPTGFPFDTNDNRFEIRYNTGMEMQSDSHLHSDSYGDVERPEPYRRSHGPDIGGPVSGLSSGTTGLSTTQALTDTYYIYSVDGKLLAEYDHGGTCRREYIYLNGKVIAEYKGGKYYYYTTDHINSTRVIADDSGTIMYKAYYGPYGEEMTTADDVKLIDPKMKFSGKEREAYSDLDYFGARYYDNHSYRFISVDPVMNREEALVDPQLLNLYVYCRNNPMTYFDPDGANSIAIPAEQQVIMYVAATGPYAVIAAAFAGYVYMGVKANEAGYRFKTARQYESEMMRNAYQAWFGKKTDNVILSKGKDKQSDKKERSEYPPGQRKTYSSRKKAKEAAKRASKGKPVNHPKGKHGPHFHPGDGKGKPLNHDHYNYPKKKKRP